MQLWEKEQVQTLLPAIGIMSLLAIVLFITMGNKEDRIRRIPLQVITVILLVLEAIKQISSALQGYDLYHIPLHFCSLFLYVLPVMAFYNGKHRQKVNAVGAAICSALAMLMLIYPGLIYSGGNVQAYFTDVFSFHTVTFHNVVMFGFFVILALNLHIPKPGDSKYVVVFALGFAVVAGTMAQLLKTNYANFYSCNIPVLESVRLSIQPILGVGFTQLLYVLIVAALHIGFTFMSYHLYRLSRGIIYPKRQVKV